MALIDDLNTDHITDGSAPNAKIYAGELTSMGNTDLSKFGAGLMAKELIFDPNMQSWAQAMRTIKELAQLAERNAMLVERLIKVGDAVMSFNYHWREAVNEYQANKAKENTE